jgi:O-antigen/teichoic acid export membrane protein
VSDVLDSPEAGSAALRGSALRSAAYFGGIGLSLVSTPFLVRSLSVAEFGRYTTIAALMNLVAGVTEGGLNAVALREYSTLQGEERRSALRSLMGIRYALSFAGVIVGLAFALAAGYESPLIVGAIGAGVAVVFQAIGALMTTPLQGELRFGWMATISLVSQGLQVVGIVALVLAGAGVVPFLWLGAPITLITLLMIMVLVRGRMDLTFSLRWAQVWPLLRDTIPYTAAVAVNVVYFRVTILVMSLQASDTEVSFFSTSFRVVEVLIGIPALVIGSAYPILARAERDDDDRFDYAMKRILELALLLGVWMAVCTTAGAKIAIDVIGGAEFADSVDVLRIQGLTLAATGVSVAAGYGLLTLRRYRVMLIMNAVALVVTVILTLILVPAMGAEGAALSTVVTETVLTIGMVGAFVYYRPALVGGLIGAPLILAVGAVAIGAALLTGVSAIPALVLANVVFGIGIVVIRRVPPEIGEVLRRKTGRG